MAVPDPPSATVPRVVPPSEKVTVPVAGPPPGAATVATRVTAWPKTAELPEVVSATVGVPLPMMKVTGADWGGE